MNTSTSIELTDRDYFDLFFISDKKDQNKKDQKTQKDQDKTEKIYVDVGSFNGDTIDIALKYNSNNSNLKIVAIEPIKQLCESMKQRFANNKNITIINKAAWNNKCNAEFSEYEGWAKGLSTLQPIMTQLRPVPYFAQNISKYNIECDTLDNILSECNIQNVDYLKVDTEGSEEDVLSGFTKYKNGTRFHIEFHIINLANILQRLLEMQAKIDRIALHRDSNINNHVIGIVIGEFTDNPQTDTTKEATKSSITNLPIIDSKETDKEIKTKHIKTYSGNVDRRQWILDKCKVGEKILDVGCADGWIFKNTPFQSYVTGIDLDIYDIPNFQQMDAHHLEFPDKSFDTVILGELLEHVENPIQVLKEADRVGKRVLMTIPDEINWSPENYPFETIEQGMERRNLTLEQIVKVSNPNTNKFYIKDNHKHLFHNRYYTEDTLKLDLENAGITDYEMIRLQYGKPRWSFFMVETIITQLTDQTIYDTVYALNNDTKGHKGPIITTGPLSRNTPLRIGLISTPFFTIPPKGYSGLEMVVWDLACGLDELGHDVTIFGTEGSQPTANGHIVITGPSINTVGIDWLEEERKRYNVYKDIITPEKYDVIIDHTWFAFAYLIKMNNPKLRLIHVHHGGYVWESCPPIPKPNLVAISKWMKSNTEQYFRQKGYNIQCEYAYNGVDLNKYKFDPNIKKTNRLLYVGRFSRFKQPDMAIRVAKKVGLPIDLIGGTFVDDPNYLKEIESMCDGKDIVMYKDVDHQFKIKKLQEAKALLVPSKFREPFGLTCVEGMACGTAVIATPDGAIPEIVLHTKTGFICDNEEQMEHAVIYHIQDINPEDCRKRAEEFSMLNMAKRYIELTHKIIRGDEW